MTTPPAAPCVECGSTGGYIPKDQNRPLRRRGLCSRCYDHHWNHGSGNVAHHIGYTACYPSNAGPEYVIWHTLQGERHAHALPFRDDYSTAAVQAEAEAFAAEWLASHPDYAAKWCPPEVEAA
jgi:hypothetical protein